MSKTCKNKLVTSFVSLVFLLNSSMVWSVQNKAVIDIKKSDKAIINDYLDLHKKFISKNCKPGTEEKFWKLFADFRGDGHFIPETTDGKLDTLTVNRFIPELQKKGEWIEEQIQFVARITSFGKLLKDIKDLKAMVQTLLDYKQQFYEARDDSEKKKARNRSKYVYIDFKVKFKSFLEKVPFMLSYRHPVDHFELRDNFDQVKHSEKPIGKNRANEIYFYRKIVQDGAQNPDRSSSDTFLRANLDTIILSLKNDEEFLSEDLRFDLNSALSGIERQINKGKKKQILRLKEWKDRNDRTLDFYKSLKDNKVLVKDHFETGEQIIQAKSKARYALKTFVLNKKVDAYKYWMQTPEVMRALFSIETILFNEVGGYDGRDALERRDVAQVVINRTTMPEYSVIPKNESMFEKLNSDPKSEEIKTNPWLNVMFKEGEFSFTYFFIHGNVRIYCPDMTRNGRFLLKENLRIALELLREPNYEFKAVRYFSRASMLGRIKMDGIWDEFVSVPERAGKKSRRNERLLALYKQGKYNYLYNFNDDHNRTYKVVEIQDNLYSYDPERKEMHYHRSPHFFRYFQKAK